MGAIPQEVDLLVVGGGINGAGIARDAAGRGLSVLLAEQDDIASATSSYSSKLIHGGLRYLEQYEFRLVREALQEREVLLKLAPHLIRPLEFMLPHDASMRPAWMIQVGMWLYDHLGGRITLPKSRRIRLPDPVLGAAIKADFHSGFVYSDCQVDDARLTLVNALSARDKGATVLTRTRFLQGERVDGAWRSTLQDLATGERFLLRSRGLVNAAGPWVADVLDRIPDDRINARVRLVKGSHIIVPRVHDHGHAYILQNADDRVVFVIPYEGRFSLVGTTDVAVQAIGEAAAISPQETQYLVDAANRFLAKPLSITDVVSSYAGVRPLYDDGSANPSEVTRDYVLKVDHEGGKAPLLSIFGGKITTYRCLAEEAVAKLAPFFPGLRPQWTAGEALPGGDIASADRFRAELGQRYAGLPGEVLDGVARRHGSLATRVLGEAKRPEDLGTHFGAGLTAREIDYQRSEEWARTAEDVLWRRTKAGLHLDPSARAAVAAYVEAAR